jgi:adenylate cyclase
MASGSQLINTLLERPRRQAEIAQLLARLTGGDPKNASLTEAGELAGVLEKLSALVHVSTQVAGSLSLDTLLDRIVIIATELTSAERGTLFLNDPDSNELFSKVAMGDLRHEIRVPNSAGIAGLVYTSGQPVIIPDAYADSRFDQEVDRRTGFQTRQILCAPVRTASQEVIGVIQLLNRREGVFGAEDLALLGSITSQAAAALVNARLFEQVVQSQREEQRVREMIQTVSSELQIRPLLRKIVVMVSELLQADRSTVFLNDPKTNELYLYLGQGLGEEIRFPNHVGIAGSVFLSGESLNLKDAYTDTRFNQAVDRQTGYRTKSILCMAIRNREGRHIGVMQAVNKSGGPFTRADERRLEMFTAQVAVAIENARLFEEVADMKNYNESMLESMSNGVLTLDEDGKVQKCNRSVVEILKTVPETLIGTQAAAFFTDANAWVLENVAKVARTGAPEMTFDSELLLAGGDRASVNLTVARLNSGRGEAIGNILVFEDITAAKRAKTTMARYMAKEVADKLLEAGGDALGGQCQMASVLFCDIRSFTTLSEQLGPQETVSMLNEYFTVMVESVFKHGGILDKFIGDAMMALFGVPFPREDDADRAVQAAIGMLRDLREFNRERVTAGKPPIEIGVGINTDQVVSGNIGSRRRMDYTSIGDGVNLAARLESSCKQYGVDVILSEFTRRALRKDYKMREIDRVVVKGKTAPVVIYELLDHRDAQYCPKVEETLGAFEEGLALYRAQDWAAAIERFEGVVRTDPHDQVAATYVARARHFMQYPPGQEWDGVWVMTAK